MGFKNRIKKYLPEFILNWMKSRELKRFKNKPLTEVFSTIYKENLWGGKQGEFYSGPGTTNSNTKLYIDKISQYIKDNNIKTIVDVGCGDYKLLNQIVLRTKVNFIGCDIVPELIESHNQNYGNDNVKFEVVNAVDDSLPNGDLCLIRQVLQHLSNDQIKKILEKTKAFKHVIITEHIPLGLNVKPNVDKAAGPDIRIRKNSGVFVDFPPFNQNTTILLEYEEDFPIFNRTAKALMRSSIIKN